MRTTVQAQPAAAAQPAEPGARRRERLAREALPEYVAPGIAAAPQAPAIAATVRLLPVGEGLYALRIGELAGPPRTVAGIALPAAQVCAPPSDESDGVEVIAAYPEIGPWVGQGGGVLVLRSPPGGGHVMVTVYGAPGQQLAEPPVDLEQLDGPVADEFGSVAAAPAAAHVAPAAGRDVATEILLHIERAGDRLFAGRGWVGALGRRMRIEAFTIRPTERLAPADIELKAFLPGGGETPWIPGGVLCGTRGRGMPLVGFAVRVTPQQADRFEVVYQGSFFAGGISEACHDGAPCLGSAADDPLEAINVRLIERADSGVAS
jgi:hypothetical protein